MKHNRLIAALILVSLFIVSCNNTSTETTTSVSTTITEITSEEVTEISETSEEVSFMPVEIFISDAGMPQIEADEHSIEVTDDSHPELKAAVEDICATYEALYEGDEITYRLYRVDRELISFVVTVSEADIENGYTLNMRGEELSIRDVVADFPESCRSSIEDQISFYVDNQYINYEPAEVDLLTYDNAIWWIDANSLVLLIDGYTYRVPFGEGFADEIVNYDGEYFAVYVEGELGIDGDTLSFFRGALTYDELSQMTLSFNGEAVDILPEGFDSTAGVANGYVYHPESGPSYLWIRHQGWYDEFYFRELLEIGSGSADVIYMDRGYEECVFDQNDLTALIP
jgi:hypothetical protein